MPDPIPVLVRADDVTVVALAPRSAARRAGPASLARYRSGTPEGLRAVRRLAGPETA